VGVPVCPVCGAKAVRVKEAWLMRLRGDGDGMVIAVLECEAGHTFKAKVGEYVRSSSGVAVKPSVPPDLWKDVKHHLKSRVQEKKTYIAETGSVTQP